MKLINYLWSVNRSNHPTNMGFMRFPKLYNPKRSIVRQLKRKANARMTKSKRKANSKSWRETQTMKRSFSAISMSTKHRTLSSNPKSVDRTALFRSKDINFSTMIWKCNRWLRSSLAGQSFLRSMNCSKRRKRWTDRLPLISIRKRETQSWCRLREWKSNTIANRIKWKGGCFRRKSMWRIRKS
jgi:hypothetical protein